MYGFLFPGAGPGEAPAMYVRPTSSVESICAGCETQWAGDAPCWSCGGPGELKAEMHGPKRLVWGFTNGFSPNWELAEGDPL